MSTMGSGSGAPPSPALQRVAVNAALLASELERMKENLETIAERAEALKKAADEARQEMG